ncbi:hypothetical protein B0H14DRAFT_2840565, partial [Mycena olivaceomarginata]
MSSACRRCRCRLRCARCRCRQAVRNNLDLAATHLDSGQRRAIFNVVEHKPKSKLNFSPIHLSLPLHPHQPTTNWLLQIIVAYSASKTAPRDPTGQNLGVAHLLLHIAVAFVRARGSGGFCISSFASSQNSSTVSPPVPSPPLNCRANQLGNVKSARSED